MVSTHVSSKYKFLRTNRPDTTFTRKRLLRKRNIDQVSWDTEIKTFW